jgi:hypothetical protein
MATGSTATSSALTMEKKARSGWRMSMFCWYPKLDDRKRKEMVTSA